MKKSTLITRLIQRFYGVATLDEYSEQEINRIGNRLLVPAYWRLLLGMMTISLTQYVFGDIVYQIFFWLVAAGVILVLPMIVRFKVNQTDIDQGAPRIETANFKRSRQKARNRAALISTSFIIVPFGISLLERWLDKGSFPWEILVNWKLWLLLLPVAAITALIFGALVYYGLEEDKED